MQHLKRNLIRFVVLVILMIAWSAPSNVWAQLESSLRGEYDLVWTRQCITEDTGGGSGTTAPFILQGKLNFDGTGGGSFIGETMVVVGTITTANPVTDGVGDAFDFTQNDVTGCVLLYTVNTEGILLATLNSCTLTFTSGSVAGQTGSLNGLTIEGKLALDGTVLLLRSTKHTSPTNRVETIQVGANPVAKRICLGDGMATSNR